MRGILTEAWIRLDTDLVPPSSAGIITAEIDDDGDIAVENPKRRDKFTGKFIKYFVVDVWFIKMHFDFKKKNQ